MGQQTQRRKLAALCALLCLIVQSSLATEHETFNRLPVPADYQDAIGTAVSLGLIVYQKDYAASVATDEMATRGLFDDSRLRGWITDRQGEAWRVVYVGGVGGIDHALYTIDVKDGVVDPQTYQYYADGRDLTDRQQGLWQARQLALSSSPSSCGEGTNAVVLPMNANDGTLQGYFVYLLAATSDPNIIQMGGHRRVQIAKDAKRVLGSVSFTNSCITLDKSQDGPLLVTHSLAPTPEEPHVLLSLLHGRELFVATLDNDLIWSVAGVDVTLIPRPKN